VSQKLAPFLTQWEEVIAKVNSGKPVQMQISREDLW
jgi:hypothetical protein